MTTSNDIIIDVMTEHKSKATTYRPTNEFGKMTQREIATTTYRPDAKKRENPRQHRVIALTVLQLL